MINPGDTVQHRAAPGKYGTALIREMHGGGDTPGSVDEYPVWLVKWDAQDDYDRDHIALSTYSHYHTEDTLQVVNKAAPISADAICTRRAGKTKGVLRMLLLQQGLSPVKITKIFDEVFGDAPSEI